MYFRAHYILVRDEFYFSPSLFSRASRAFSISSFPKKIGSSTPHDIFPDNIRPIFLWLTLSAVSLHPYFTYLPDIIVSLLTRSNYLSLFSLISSATSVTPKLPHICPFLILSNPVTPHSNLNVFVSATFIFSLFKFNSDPYAVASRQFYNFFFSSLTVRFYHSTLDTGLKMNIDLLFFVFNCICKYFAYVGSTKRFLL